MSSEEPPWRKVPIISHRQPPHIYKNWEGTICLKLKTMVVQMKYKHFNLSEFVNRSLNRLWYKSESIPLGNNSYHKSFPFPWTCQNCNCPKCVHAQSFRLPKYDTFSYEITYTTLYEKAPWIWRLCFGIKCTRKHLLVYDISEAATESPVYTYKSATIGQAFYSIKCACTWSSKNHILALPSVTKGEEHA